MTRTLKQRRDHWRAIAPAIVKAIRKAQKRNPQPMAPEMAAKRAARHMIEDRRDEE